MVASQGGALLSNAMAESEIPPGPVVTNQARITFHVSQVTPSARLFPQPLDHATRIHSTLLRVFSSVPLHSRETTPSDIGRHLLVFRCS